jgi:hypothetical protein
MVSFDGGVESIDIQIIDRFVVTPAIYLFLMFKDLSVCSQVNAILWLLPSLLLWFDISYPLMVLFALIFSV